MQEVNAILNHMSYCTMKIQFDDKDLFTSAGNSGSRIVHNYHLHISNKKTDM